MISAWELYLWTRLDSINTLNEVTLVLSGFVTILGVLFYLIESGHDLRDSVGRWLLRFILPFTLFMAITSVLLPTTKQAAMIWVVPQLATIENAELLKGEAAEIYNLAKEALKESVGTNKVDK